MTKVLSDRLLLLDVNVLLALAWPTHQFHAHAVARLERTPHPRWATCALTQLGLVRLSSNPAVVGVAKLPAEALDVLRALTADAAHEFLTDRPLPGLAEAELARTLGHRQVTDAYLLAIARVHDAALLTLDRRLLALAGAPELVEFLA